MSMNASYELPSPYSGPSRGTTPSRKRKFIYDPSINEQFPDVLWYNLNYEEIIVNVDKMCDELTIPLQQYAATHAEIRRLIQSTCDKKKLPKLKQLRLAVLGEQGVGKSSLINALLDRDILDNSGSSRACTALATILVWKESASDYTNVSDVKIEFLNNQEIRDSIDEQILRWTEVYPGHQGADGGNDLDTDSDDSADDEITPSLGLPTQVASKNVSKAKKRAASTAREFFEIVFNTHEDECLSAWLEDVLHTTDIGRGDFADLCGLKTQERLDQIGTQLRVQNRVAEFQGISDKKLGGKQNLARKLWPFVKLVTIATGHVLLRHGLCLLDLPGYGDTSHLRQGVINHFRWAADFEMVVVPGPRVATSITHERYLERSVHMKGAKKTVVVMNKSDQLIDQTTMFRQIQQITDEPFPSFSARLEHINSLEEEEMDEDAIAKMVDNFVSDVTVAFVKRETDLFRSQMQEKGIAEVYSAAASVYMAWKDRYRRHDPVLSPEESGIPALRHFLFRLPAKTNFLDYRDHVFETLPALRVQARCVAEKHIEDKDYADMRQALREALPVLKDKLQNLIPVQINDLITEPWSSNEDEYINKDIKHWIKQNWVDPKIRVNGFAKMLRENGIPLIGKYVGRNLNNEILGTMQQRVEQWSSRMETEVEKLTGRLNQPVQELLQHFGSCLNTSSTDPALKRRATEAMDDASRRIETAYNTLVFELNESLRENRLRFTTEIDINCPVARQMKTVYKRAQEVESGKGVYARQRMSILKSTMRDKQCPHIQPFCPLTNNLGRELVNRQKELWIANCNAFAAEVIAQLDVFSETTKQLLKDDAYMAEEHKEAREQLESLLVDFDKSLKAIQDCFDGASQGPRSKKIKLEVTESESMSSTMLFEFDPEVPAIPIMKNKGWFDFLESFGRLPPTFE